MTVVDEFEAERRRIEELWSNLKPEIIRDLVNVWIDKEQLQELKADVERLEPKIIKLLEILSTSRKHTAEYHAHTVHLVSLLHNVKSKESWRQKIIEDLDYISSVADKIHEAIGVRKKLRASQQSPSDPIISKPETPKGVWEQRKDELRPPPKSFKELIDTSDTKTWKRVGPFNSNFGVPYPTSNPKSYYIIPNPKVSMNTVPHSGLNKVYPSIQDKDLLCQYVIQKAAWVGAEVLERANFDLWKMDAMWDAEGEIGIAKRTRTKEQVDATDGNWRF